MTEETKTPELPDPQEAFWLELGPAEPEDTAAQQSVLPYATRHCRPVSRCWSIWTTRSSRNKKQGPPILGGPVCLQDQLNLKIFRARR